MLRAAWLAGLLLFLLAAPAAAAPELLTQHGGDPDAVTDRDGTTHVVWDVSVRGEPDKLEYCRIPRGSQTCADIKRLTPLCNALASGFRPEAWKQDTAEEGEVGDGPNIAVTAFGEVVLTTHGSCPVDWKELSQDTLPWRNYTAADFMIHIRSSDGGDTFPAMSQGEPRAWGARFTQTSAHPWNDGSTTVFDAVENRFLTLHTSPEGRDYDNPSGNPDVSGGIFVLGRFPPPLTSDRDSRDDWNRARLTPRRTGMPPKVVQRGAGSFAALWWTGDGAFLRTTTQGSPYDEASWTAEQQLPAEDVQAENVELVTGPLGTIVFYSAREENFQGWRFWTRRVEGATFGPRRAVTPRLTGASGDLVQDSANGRLIAVVEDPGTSGDDPLRLKYTVSDDGGQTWTPLATMDERPKGNAAILDIQLTASTGDAGFTGLVIRKQRVASHLTFTDGPIYAIELPGSGDAPPDPDPDPDPGSGGETGGGTATGGGGAGGGGGGGVKPPAPPILATPPALPPEVAREACKVRQFGPLDIKGDVCLEVDPKTGVITAKGGVNVNGLRFAEAEISFDPRQRTVKSKGPVSVSVGDTRLFRLPIDWKLPTGNVFELPKIDIGATGGKLKGFPVKGSVQIKLVRGAVEIPMHVGLPDVFGGITGDATLRADNLTGVRLRGIKVAAKLGAVGPLTFSGIEFEYDPEANRWAGGATLVIPPKPPAPSLSAKVGFVDGTLEYLRSQLEFPGNGIPLDPFNSVYLTKIRFSLATRPDLRLSGGITFSAGPKMGPVRVAEIDGDFTFILPDSGPATLRADGNLRMLTIPVANGYIQYRTSGIVNFGGSLDLKVPGDLLTVTAKVEGWTTPPDTFSVGGKGQVCVGDLGCSGGRVAVSSVGFAACVDVFGASVGASYKWGPSVLWTPAWISELDIMVGGCSVAPMEIPAKAAQAGGVRTTTVDKGLPFVVFAVTGEAAVPHVTLVAPDGRRIDAPLDRAGVVAPGVAVVHAAERKQTFVVVRRPAAGAWKVEPVAGSSPLASVRHAEGLPEPRVRAKVVRGRGRERVLEYDVTPIRGQRVRFEERAAAGRAGASLGYAKGTRGRLRFTPAPGHTGRRRIVALVESFDRPRAELQVATYVAPAPARPRPSRLRLRRRSGRLHVSWRPPRDVVRYRLTAQMPDGRVVLLLPGARARSATLPAAGLREAIVVRLAVEARDGTLGPAAVARERPARRRS